LRDPLVLSSLHEISPREVAALGSNFANPEQESRTTMPLLRQLHIAASTVATIGKPTVVRSCG
jgi:hypothetical protein